MSSVGIIGDLHLPFTHPRYLAFVNETFKAWGVDRVVFIGDIVDHHCLGFWETDPNGLGPEREAQEALEQLDAWRRKFPEALVCIGNHDERQFRRARAAGVPDRYLRDYAEVWETPGWTWKFEHEIEGVLYQHGTGSSGKDAAIARAKENRISTVIGHVHSFGGVKYSTSERDRIFGMNVGCGIECSSYAFAYGKAFPVRPTLGCGVVVDGIGYFEPMLCGKGEQWHKDAK